MTNVIASIVNLITIALLIAVALFLYLAYADPETLSELYCNLRTDGVLDYAACRVNTSR
jgi:hypothetical protein